MLNDKFFQLLRYSIGVTNVAPQLTEEEWQSIYELAKKQSLVGVAFMGVSRLPAELQPPKRVKLNWYLQAEKIIKRNAQVNKVAVGISEAFAKKRCRNCILKGQGNALMYPKPELRTCGDVDIWVASAPADLIKLAKAKRPTAKAEYHHIDFAPIGGIAVELHYRPSFMNNLINNARMQRWFVEQGKVQMEHRVELPDGVGQIPAPTDSFNRIYQMAHISNHVIHEGIGLRQLLDYYYLLQRGFTAEEQQEDERLLKYFGLYDVARAVMYVLREVFGLTADKMIVSVDERRGAFLLEEILQAGNFGHYDERVKHDGGAWQQNVQRLRRDLRLLRYFPSECLWEPVFRWYHFFWRLRHR